MLCPACGVSGRPTLALNNFVVEASASTRNRDSAVWIDCNGKEKKQILVPGSIEPFRAKVWGVRFIVNQEFL